MKDLCSKYLENLVVEDNFNQIYCIADDFQLAQLKKTCWIFLRDHPKIQKKLNQLPKELQEEIAAEPSTGMPPKKGSLIHTKEKKK